MPELPEVESIRTQLEKFLIGHKILEVDVRNKRIMPDDTSSLVGSSFRFVRRVGKVLIIDLDNDLSLLAHVKMTGQFLYKGPNLKDNKPISAKVVGGIPGIHTHVVFKLDKGGFLYYNDVRRFGWIKIVATKNSLKGGLVGKMGPEPFSGLTQDIFEKILSSSKKAIKVLLMDQAKIGGVGNIYANDALYLAKIDPRVKANNLDQKKVNALFDALNEVLKDGMKYGGSSENSFVTPDGQEGSYQRHTLVYGKEKTECIRCGTQIVKFQLSSRGTYMCPVCQSS